jgi:heme-degrading monooxygenase HmoA
VFSVIFEVNPAEGKKDEYLGIAKHLKPIIETIDGFVDNERFESQLKKGWILSHSTWRDEKSVIRWRTQSEHHKMQEKGRFEVFRDYRLQIGDVTFDTNPPAEAPVLERRFDETEVGPKMVTFTEITPEKDAAFASQFDMLASHFGLDTSGGGVADHEVYASIYNPGKLALLVAWKDAQGADAWTPNKIEGVKELRHRKVRVVRKYGRFDRREAPQYYDDVNDGKTIHAEPRKKGT